MLKILDRYLLRELVAPFLFCVTLVFLLLVPTLLFNLTDLMVKTGASVSTIGKLMLYNVPTIFVMAFPVSFLAAALLSIGRMSRDFEIIAMRAMGLGLRRIIRPIIFASLVVSGLAFAINEGLVPPAKAKLKTTIQEMLKGLQKPPIRPNTFFQGTNNRHFYIQEVSPQGVMKGVFIFDKTKDGFPQVIQAEQARWIGNVWRLEFGTNYRYDREGFITTEVAFKTMDIAISLDATNLLPSGLDLDELSTQQLSSQLKDLQKAGGAASNMTELRLHKKFAFPLASFFAALLAAPLGLMFSRMGGYIGVAFTIILVFLYYVTMQIAEALAKFGHIPGFAGAWASNLIFLLVGGILLWRMDRN